MGELTPFRAPYTYPPGSDALDERAGAFCRWYRVTHREIRGVPYIPSRMVKGRDYDAALRMCAELTDEHMHQAAELWLRIPAEREPMIGTGARTLSKLLAVLPEILERLQGRGGRR